MRQGQNAKRSRGRGRKQGGSNRTFESNGPDVKIRGSASHIHEKYQSLARDANSAGDRVAAENYLQHAEHYFRLMAAAQPTPANAPQPAARDKDQAEAAAEEKPNGGGRGRGRKNGQDKAADDGSQDADGAVRSKGGKAAKTEEEAHT